MSRNLCTAKYSLVFVALAMALSVGGGVMAEGEGWLGVMLQPLTDDIASAMDLDKGVTGVLVNDVVDGSPADEADIEKGDVIIEIDGTAITGVEQAVDLVRSHAAGEEVKLVAMREGKKQVFTVTLGERGKMEKATPFEGVEKDFSRVLREPRVERFFEGSKDLGERCLKEFDLGRGGHIGVRVQDVTADLGPYFGVGKDEGVLILDVVEESPAAKAGLRGGDVVIKVDGKPVCCTAPFVEAIRQHEPGEMVEITFKRQGETRRLDVEVGKGPKLVERFLGEAGAPGVRLWEENAPGGCKRIKVMVDDERRGPMGEGPKCIDLGDRGCIIIGDDCCKGMMGEGMKCKGMGECKRKCMMMSKGMDECMQMCKEMGEKCKGMMGKDMEECMKKCEMMKQKCEGMMGEGPEACMPEGKSMRKMMIMKPGDDDDPVKCFMKQSEMKGELNDELEALRHEIESLKKEIQGLKR